MMRRILLPATLTAVVALCLGFVPGCSDDDDNGTEPESEPITLEDFAGSWTATKYVLSSQGNPSIRFAIIAWGGSVTMVIAGDGTFTGEAYARDPDNPEELLTIALAGNFSLVDQEHVQVTFTPEILPLFTSFTGEFTLSGDTLEIADPDTTFDFDRFGTEEPAILEVTLVRS